MPELLAQSPQPRPDEKNRHRNHKARRRRHQSINPDSLPIRLTRTPQNRKRHHVRSKQRQKENQRPDRPIRQKEIFGIRLAASKRDAADERDDREINKDDNNRNHFVSSLTLWVSSTSRCAGQIV